MFHCQIEVFLAALDGIMDKVVDDALGHVEAARHAAKRLGSLERKAPSTSHESARGVNIHTLTQPTPGDRQAKRKTQTRRLSQRHRQAKKWRDNDTNRSSTASTHPKA